jgi:uncharacterized protein YpmB
MKKKRRFRLDDDIKIQLVILVILFAILLPLISCSHKDHHDKIESRVESRGGKLISAKENNWSGDDPFKWHEHGKGVSIWEFKYRDKNGKVQHGWVKFSGWNTRWTSLK